MRRFLFAVDRLEFVGGGNFIVAGRNCRDELRVGDLLQFTSRCCGEETVVPVRQIIMHGRLATEVAPGLVAGLVFDNHLSSRFFLGAELHGEGT